MNRLICALLISLPGIYPHEARAMDAADPIAALVQGNNAFALDLYARLGQGEGNRFISPFSISTALAMTYAGAQDDTAVEIAKALRFTLPPSQLHSTFHKLLADLHGRTAALAAPDRPADVQLFMANALWTQAGEQILPDFQKQIEINYQGGLYPVDFRHASEEARQTINTWVEQQTKGKIKDLLKSAQIDPKTLLIITNAIYFKALWASPFSKERTSPADFHASPSDVVRVDMMKQSGRFRYAEEASFQALELPYKGDTLAMVILLPRASERAGPAGIVADRGESRELPRQAVIAPCRSEPSQVQVDCGVRAQGCAFGAGDAGGVQAGVSRFFGDHGHA